MTTAWFNEMCGALYGETSDGDSYRLGVANGDTFFPSEEIRFERGLGVCSGHVNPVARKYSNGVVWFHPAWRHPIECVTMPAFAFYDPEHHFYQFSHLGGVQYNDPIVYDLLRTLLKIEKVKP